MTDVADITTWPIGREDSEFTSDMTEHIRWVGKPWRRVELLWHRFTWKGETEITDWDLTVHLGWPRFAIGVSVILSRGGDYSEERP